MAIKSTIFKADLQIADLDRGYYADHALTVARHPSETEERMMVRLLAFVMHADADLSFGGGLSTDDEPALWRKDLTGAIKLWIDVGLPDEKLIRRACGRADQVRVIAYGSRTLEVWWTQNKDKLARLANLGVYSLHPTDCQAMATLVSRSMRLQCTVQEGHIWLTDGQTSVQVEPVVLQAAAKT